MIKEEKARFGLRWLYKQAADCYSWLFIRDHKSKEIRTAKVPGEMNVSDYVILWVGFTRQTDNTVTLVQQEN